MTDPTSSAPQSKRGRIAIVPRWVYTRVTDGAALRLYTHLAGEYCDTDRYCFPSEELLGDELGYSRSTLQRSLRTLRSIGAIRVDRKRKRNGHLGRNTYVLPMDDPRDLDMHGDVLPDYDDLSGQQEQGIVAGRDQASGVTHDHGSPVTHQEPYPLKQPYPSSKSKDQHSAGAPSPHRGDGPRSAQKDHDDVNPAPPVQAGFQPQPPRRLDDEEQQPTLNQEFPWSGSWEDQRVDRLVAYVDVEVEGLSVVESHAVVSMVECGVHPNKVINTIRRQRELGYVG